MGTNLNWTVDVRDWMLRYMQRNITSDPYQHTQ